MGGGLGDASAFLLAMKDNANTPAMSGFYIPPQILAYATGEVDKRAAVAGRGAGPVEGAERRADQEIRLGLRFARRTRGAVLDPDQIQPVQHRRHGPGQRDHQYRAGGSTEHHAVRCQDIGGRVAGHAQGHPRLLRPRPALHHHHDHLRGAADFDRPAARGRCAALSDRFGDRFVSVGTRHRRHLLPIHTRPAKCIGAYPD